MFEDMKWEKAQNQIDIGDLLLMYTDGVTEAQNSDEELYDDERLIAVGSAKLGHSARDIQEGVINSIHDFVGDAPQFDDITLVVVSRGLTT
jgi:sigma-B regulation protein RsbU (phosphoserine phosphatase)